MAGFLMGRRGLIDSPWEVGLEDFDIVFIADALARQGRYLGHGGHFLSVAEHSVYLSYLVPEEDAFAALLHDAPEAFVGDVHAKIKGLMELGGDNVFRRLEMFFWGLVCAKFGIVELPESVATMDVAIRKLELDSLHSPYHRRWFAALNPDDAAELFLARAFELSPILMEE